MLSADPEHGQFKMVDRSAWQGDSDETFVEPIQAESWREAMDRVQGITDILLVALYPADEEDRLQEVLKRH